MLHYFGKGFRDYSTQPIPLKQRPCWEFQAILSGSCTLCFQDHSIPVEGPIFWVFRPGTAHGWSSKTGTLCEIIVFHFDYVPDAFAEYIGNQKTLHMRLLEEDIEMLRAAIAEVEAYAQEFTYMSLLRYDILVHRLALLVIERSDGPANCSNLKPDVQRVNRALAFYREHMAEKIGVEDVARATACSVAHLRRLFHSVLGTSVKNALLREQMHLAADRLKDPYCTVSGVADLCGFSCVSSFSRAFRTMTGLCPSEWRASHPRQNPKLDADRSIV
jgi:AraC-like DNA-binding protein